MPPPAHPSLRLFIHCSRLSPAHASQFSYSRVTDAPFFSQHSLLLLPLMPPPPALFTRGGQQHAPFGLLAFRAAPRLIPAVPPV